MVHAAHAYVAKMNSSGHALLTSTHAPGALHDAIDVAAMQGLMAANHWPSDIISSEQRASILPHGNSAAPLGGGLQDIRLVQVVVEVGDA